MCTLGQCTLMYFSHLVGGQVILIVFLLLLLLLLLLLYLVLGIEPMAKQVDYH